MPRHFEQLRVFSTIFPLTFQPSPLVPIPASAFNSKFSSLLRRTLQGGNKALISFLSFITHILNNFGRMPHKTLGSGYMWMSNTTCLNPNITKYHASTDKRSKGDYGSNYQGHLSQSDGCIGIGSETWHLS